jgi:hypothetical protein
LRKPRDTLLEKSTWEEQKIMDNDNLGKPSSTFLVKDLYKQAEKLGLRSKILAQRKLTLNEHHHQMKTKS